MFSSTFAFALHIFLISVFAVESSSTPNSLTETIWPINRQISSEVLRCKSSSPIVKGICDVALQKINSELERAGISVRKDGILFTFDDSSHESIPTGHSCSVTAKVRHKHASAHFSSSSKLKLSAKSLSDAIALRLHLPVHVTAKVDVRQRFGFRFFGKCKRYARDTFSMKAGANTKADVVVGLSLNPSFKKLANGNFEITLKPAVAALFELNDLDLKFRVSKVSPITPIWTFIVGFKSSLLKSISRLFEGDSLKSVLKGLKQSLLYDFGAPVVLGIGALPRPLEALIFDALGNIAEREVERKAKGFGENLEDKLNDELRRALKVGADGKRVIIIKGNFLELLEKSANADDVFVEPPRSSARRARHSRRLRRRCVHSSCGQRASGRADVRFREEP